MRALFVIGFVLGLAGVLAAAHFVPGIDPVRLPSHTSVVANGGRAETFVIRLPADRLAASGADSAGLRAAHTAAALPAELTAAPVLVEHFKVRDADGDVIGTAARHWTADGQSAGTAWLVALPGRGAMLLQSAGERAGAVDRALASAGHRAGASWSGEARAVVAGDAAPGSVLGGTDEFAALDGRYTETWTVTGVDADGELKGTVELRTVTFVDAV